MYEHSHANRAAGDCEYEYERVELYRVRGKDRDCWRGDRHRETKTEGKRKRFKHAVKSKSLN